MGKPTWLGSYRFHKLLKNAQQHSVWVEAVRPNLVVRFRRFRKIKSRGTKKTGVNMRKKNEIPKGKRTPNLIIKWPSG
jgi:hypothetical protein